MLVVLPGRLRLLLAGGFADLATLGLGLVLQTCVRDGFATADAGAVIVFFDSLHCIPQLDELLLFDVDECGFHLVVTGALLSIIGILFHFELLVVDLAQALPTDGLACFQGMKPQLKFIAENRSLGAAE